MPRRALRCIVDLKLQTVSAPGVWLPSKEDVYLSVSFFNQYRNTRLVASVFPLLIHETFRFEKTYYTAIDPAMVAEMLEDELIIFELVQLSEYTDGAVRLASYSTNARDFLYPYSTLAPSYSAHEREVLMCRTIAFPGISPKLEFSSTTVIKESISAELDALDDAVDMERASRSRRRSLSRGREYDDTWAERPSSRKISLGVRKRNSEGEGSGCPPHYCMPTVTTLCRSRSPSPSMRRKLADIHLDGSPDPRPPFVVRKLDDKLIGRTPSSVTDSGAKSKLKRSASPFRYRSRSVSPSRRSVLDSLDLSYKPSYRISKVIREPYIDPLPVFKPIYTSYDDNIDNEVASLTSLRPTYTSPRPRSVSPLLYRSSFRDRYGDLILPRVRTPSYYELLAEQERELARSRSLSRIYSNYYRSIDDLDLELRLARIRAGRY